MFRLQNVMYDTTEEGKKTMNQQKALEFIHEYLKEQEREEKSAQNQKFE